MFDLKLKCIYCIKAILTYTMSLSDFMNALILGHPKKDFPEKWIDILLENLDTLVERRIFDIMRVMEHVPRLNTTKDYESVHKWYELFDKILKYDNLLVWKDAFQQTSQKIQKEILHSAYMIADDEFHTIFKKEAKIRCIRKNINDINAFVTYSYIVEYNTVHIDSFIKRCRYLFKTDKELFFYFRMLLNEIDESMYHLPELKACLFEFYTKLVPYVIELIKKLPNLTNSELRGSDIFIDMPECTSSPELADVFIQTYLQHKTCAEWRQYIEHSAFIDGDQFGATDTYSGNFIRALRRNNINSYVELFLYESDPNCVIQYDIYEMVNLLIMDIRNDKIMYEKTIIEAISENAIYCFQYLMESFETIYKYRFTYRFVRAIIKELSYKSQEQKIQYITIIKNFIPDFELYLLSVSRKWSKYVSCSICHENTNDRCVVSYEVPKSYFKKCSSNVPHIVTLDVYTQLVHKVCPYCRMDYKPELFHQIQVLDSRE